MIETDYPYEMAGHIVGLYGRALPIQAGDLHLHLAPGFAEGFLDRGEGHAPVLVNSVLDPHVLAQVRAEAVAAYDRVAPHSGQVWISVDLSTGLYEVHVPEKVPGAPQEGFERRFREVTRWRRAQVRLARVPWLYGPGAVLAILCLLALPGMAEADDNFAVLAGLVLIPLALPWLFLLTPVVLFRDVGAAFGAGALAEQRGGSRLSSAMPVGTIGRRTLWSWIGWAMGYALVVGTVYAVGVFVVYAAEDPWIAGPSPAEALGMAFVAGVTVVGLVLVALGFTYIVAVMVSYLAMSVAPDHDELFPTTAHRRTFTYIGVYLVSALVVATLHVNIFPLGPSAGGRASLDTVFNVWAAWRAGPLPWVPGWLVVVYWCGVAVTGLALVLAVVAGIRGRMRLRTAR